jgi:hypothetical protein
MISESYSWLSLAGETDISLLQKATFSNGKAWLTDGLVFAHVESAYMVSELNPLILEWK